MPPQDLTLSVVRPDDLLVLVLEFEGVLVSPPQPGQPGEIQGASGARLTVHLQPQHIAEQAFFQDTQDHQDTPGLGSTTEPPTPPGSVGALLAGNSRLVFRVAAGETLPFTLEGILDALQRLPLRVSPIQTWKPPGCFSLDRLVTFPPSIAVPAADVTAIEAPYRLILSPDAESHWRHALTPVVKSDWTELWHSRIGSDRSDGDPRVRAIWSPDFQATDLQAHANVPFRMSLDGRDRNQIVHVTSNYKLPGFLPEPVETEQFTLSTLGAWLEVEGTWEPPALDANTPLTLVNWRHEASMGRDQYVRVVEAGYLYPYGHRAVLVTITERKFFYRAGTATPGHIAYLYQRQFIIVRERTRTYAERDMPLRKVTFKTRVTPNLMDSQASQVAGVTGVAFWPRVSLGAGPQDFQFHLVGEDWEGRTVEWTTPALFVDLDADLPANNAPIFVEYNTTHGVSHARRMRPFHGQMVAFAPSKKAGDTALIATNLTLEGIELTSGDGPHFRPAMKQATVDVPAVRQLLGSQSSSTIEWEDSYLAGSGTSIGNAGDVFVKLLGSTPLEFATEKVGGMVAPDLGISGLSRSLGPVGGTVDKLVGGSFDPLDIFGQSVKLLGGIDLWEIVMDLVFSAGSTTADKLPGLVTEQVGDVIVTRYTWKLGTDELVQDHTLFRPTPSSEFILEATLEAPLDGSEPDFTVSGALTNFSTVLLPGIELVELTFASVSFESGTGKKTDVSVELAGIDFQGILEFVKELQEFIPQDGFSAGPDIEMVAAPDPGVNVGFTLGIPDIAIGIMTIQNISLSAGVFLPFGDAPLNFHFAFCERQQPFILTVSLFGGGGFFAIDVGVDGVKLIEASLEFGASAAINLGVASGEATLMAGFYFQMAGADFELTGYFRAYGSLSVLGIISISLEFYLGLSYASKGISPHGGTLWGQASLTVKIEILFFSVSVSVGMEREFSGSDPKFRELVSHSDWEHYVDAFAAYPA